MRIVLKRTVVTDWRFDSLKFVMTADKLYTSLTANTIMAKLTNRFQQTRLITSSTDKLYSLDFEDDVCSGCRNVSHQQQFFPELHSPERSHYMNYWEVKPAAVLTKALDGSSFAWWFMTKRCACKKKSSAINENRTLKSTSGEDLFANWKMPCPQNGWSLMACGWDLDRLSSAITISIYLSFGTW